MKPKKVFFGYLIVWAFAAVLILLSFIGEYPNIVLLSIGIGLLIAGYIAFLILYRCPHCGKHLWNRVAPWHYCPYCGEHLDADPSPYETYEVDEEERSDNIKIQ